MISLMADDIRVIPIDLENGKYIIEIPADSKMDFHDVAERLDEWIDGNEPFLILTNGMKLTRIDADDIQEET